MYDPAGLKAFFNSYGENEWERLEKNLHGRVEYEVTKHILKKHLPPDGHILDVGCGPGRYAIDLARMGYRVHLVDISEEQLRIAEERIGEAGVLGNISSFSCLDVCDLSEIPNASYDAVICLGGALSYVRDARSLALSELIRVAKPGSPLIVSVMSLLGTFHLISHFDHERFLLILEDHIEWDPSTPFPDHVNTNLKSKDWHAPMTLYTSGYMKEFLEGHGCEVLEIASTNTITSSYWDGLEKITSNPEATEMLIRLRRSSAPGQVCWIWESISSPWRRPPGDDAFRTPQIPFRP